MQASLRRTFAAVALALMMLAAGLAPVALPPTAKVDAGHNSGGSHLTDDGKIIRNVVLGTAVPVCSDDLPNSAKAAAERWNTFFGKKVFQLDEGADPHSTSDDTVFSATSTECLPEQPSASMGIGSVLVRHDASGCGGSACMWQEDMDDPWDTFTGQATIVVATYEVAVAGMIKRQSLNDGHDRVTRSVTHELGHVFGLDDYWDCRAAPAGAMNPEKYTTSETVMGPGAYPDGSYLSCSSSTPTTKDLSDYRHSYEPEAPVIVLSESPGANTARIDWDAIDVHAESGFAIQHRTAIGTWRMVGTPRGARPSPYEPIPVLEQIASWTGEGQTAGSQTYRVVSLTSAPMTGTPEDPRNSSASNAITITVRAPVTLTTSVQPADGGTISASPADSDGVYATGTTVTLTAAPASSYVFLRWSIEANDSAVTACGNPTTVTLDHDTEAAAVFEEVPDGVPPHSLTLSLSPPPETVHTPAHTTGFSITGCVRAVGGAGGAAGSTRAAASTSVTVTITRDGETTPVATLGPVTADASGAWSVSVPPNASYITDGTFNVAATATRGSVSRTVTSRFTANVAPTVSYNTVPTSMRVGTAIADIVPTTTDEDIASYALKTGSSLPSGLTLNGTSGVVSGTPSATAAARIVTIVVTDNAGNTSDVMLALPAVTQPPPTVVTIHIPAGELISIIPNPPIEA